MYLFFIWGGTYGFGWGEIHNEGRLKGWALKSRLFWALKWQRAPASAIWHMLSARISS
jgi:hypothetical protein